ncbi:4290_t:CDS:1, partial [Scutellospora calospora]
MSEKKLYDNWQKAKKNTIVALKNWEEEKIKLSKSKNKPDWLIKSVKSFSLIYYYKKNKEQDVEILYLRCKNASQNISQDVSPKRKNKVPPKLKL